MSVFSAREIGYGEGSTTTFTSKRVMSTNRVFAVACIVRINSTSSQAAICNAVYSYRTVDDFAGCSSLH